MRQAIPVTIEADSLLNKVRICETSTTKMKPQKLSTSRASIDPQNNISARYT